MNCSCRKTIACNNNKCNCYWFIKFKNLVEEYKSLLWDSESTCSDSEFVYEIFSHEEKVLQASKDIIEKKEKINEK